MFRLRIFLICLVLTILFSSIECSQANSKFNFAFVKNVTTFLNQNPDIKVIYPLFGEQTEHLTQNYFITYADGGRTGDDRLVADAWTAFSTGIEWESAKNIRFTLNYPRSGTGWTVTYIRIVVEQSTNSGRAFLISGGIGQRQYTALIEAHDTTFFSYNAEIYGR